MTDPSVEKTIAFARLPYLIRDVARDFRRLTGLTAVTTLGSATPDGQTRRLPSPPVHPLCAKLLREIHHDGPCEAEWQKHVNLAARTLGFRIHICPLGLRCAAVPIVLGDEMLGLAKVVSDQEISKERFCSLVRLLEVLIARPCQDLLIHVLREDIETLQVSVERLRLAKEPRWVFRNDTHLSASRDENNDGTLKDRTLIGRVLDYLNEHCADTGLSLAQVANAVGRNEKYVAHLFARQVGVRMRTYITTLRVRRACELLLQTSLMIKDIARQTGFTNPIHFRHSFRRIIGVTASVYRQIFGTGSN